MRAVIFDLWDTLVEWPAAEAERLRDRIAALVGVADDEFAERWRATLPRRRRPARSPMPIARSACPSDHARGAGRGAARVRPRAVSGRGPARPASSRSSAAAA